VCHITRHSNKPLILKNHDNVHIVAFLCIGSSFISISWENRLSPTTLHFLFSSLFIYSFILLHLVTKLEKKKKKKKKNISKFTLHHNGCHRPIVWTSPLLPEGCPILLKLKPPYILVLTEVLLASLVQTLVTSLVATLLQAILVKKTNKQTFKVHNRAENFQTCFLVCYRHNIDFTKHHHHFKILFQVIA